MHPDTKSPVPINLDAPKWLLDAAEQRRVTDAAMAGRPAPHLDKATVVLRADQMPALRHVLGGLAILAAACLAALGCWDVRHP